MNSIRVKVTAVTIIAILTTILALGGIGIYIIGVESDRSSVERISLISQKIQSMLNEYLNSIEQSVDMAVFTAEESIEGIDPALLSSKKRTVEQQKALDTALKAHCEQVQHAFESIAGSTHGVVAYYYCINSDLGSSEHGFFYSKLGFTKFKKKDPLISSALDPNDKEHDIWYFTPIEARRPVWVGPYKARFLSEAQTNSYAAPIYWGDTLIGVLGMDILFDTFAVQVKKVHVYDSGFVSFLDKDGHILYHPEKETGTTALESNESVNPELFRQESSGENMIRYVANGEVRQLAFSTLVNDMKVVVSAPVKEITASRRTLTRMILVFAVLLLLVFSVVIMMIMGAVTKPLLNLTAASAKLADGDYDVELNYRGKDEVGVLTNSFRQMRDHLKIYISDLNSRVYVDAMTGVKNKGAFAISSAKLDDAIRMGGEDSKPEFAILMLDCNSLKKINDEYGHERGDAYLKKAASTICNVFAHSPVFRMGGDEFTVILQRADYENRDALLKEFARMKDEINAAAKEPWEKVNISVGMSKYRPDADQNVKDVITRADERMYADKKAYYDRTGGTMR